MTTTTTNSIFAPRRKEAESRSFWDSDRVVRKALDADFGRMLKEDRIVKLMAKSDNAVVNGQKTVSESLEEVTMLSRPTRYCCGGRRRGGREGKGWDGKEAELVSSSTYSSPVTTMG